MGCESKIDAIAIRYVLDRRESEIHTHTHTHTVLLTFECFKHRTTFKLWQQYGWCM